MNFPAHRDSARCTPAAVLIVDDDPGMRSGLECSFERHGWQVQTAGCAKEGVAKFAERRPPLVVTDVRMPDEDGFYVMRRVRECDPTAGVILLTAYGSIPKAVAAMKSGACDYLVKPVAFEELEAAARRVLLQTRPADDGASEMVGNSPALLAVLAKARRVAASDADVLIQAESGTGKELLAKMIHRSSRRHSRPLVTVNCAAVPEHLLESELFGHSKGAFTGALSSKPGKFELANGGTLLLDEVGEMPTALQPKLLRALQEREFDRLGSTIPVKVDIRVIATTNRPLELMVREGCFRGDLFYRLNVVPLRLPALRERREDILRLAEHFARIYAANHEVPRFSPAVADLMKQYSWPGNVRQLANLMRRAVALCPDEIGVEVLEPGELVDSDVISSPHVADVFAGISLQDAERHLLEATLSANGGNRSRTAKILGVSLRTVRNKIRDYGLPPRRSYFHAE
jgi:DNA-binding NtrC family response regulator